MPNKIYESKKALVTGASSGIGKAIVLELAKNGIEVVLNFSKSKDRAQEVVDEIVSKGGHATLFQADITKEDEVKKLFTFVESQLGGLDILVNNAGVYIPDFVASQDFQNWDTVMNLNLKAKAVCIRYAVPLLKKSSQAHIINIATRGAQRPLEESAAYCAAAAGVIMLTQVSALELSSCGITVNTVSPGLTRTPMTEAVDTEEDFKAYADKNPLGRVGQPEDIAVTVAFLASDAAGYITGENINVSGGAVLK